MSDSLSRAQARQDGKITTRMVRAPVGVGVLADGRRVDSDVLAQRLRWLAEIVKTQAQERIFEVWTAQAVLALPKTPSHAYVAMLETYDPLPWPPQNFHASQRVLRMVEELAGRSLRSVGRSLSILEALVNFESLPNDVTEVERRNLWRSVKNYYDKYGVSPENVYDLISCPDFSAGYYTCPLDAADDQQVKLAGHRLSILLPTCEFPTKKDWAWHSMALNLPAYALDRYAQGIICKPSLRVTPTDIYFLVPLDLEVPELLAGRVAQIDAQAALIDLADQGRQEKAESVVEDFKTFGLDWGERRLLSGAIVERDGQDQISTTGRPFYFDSSELQHKQKRRRTEAEHLKAEMVRLEKEERETKRPCPARIAKIAVWAQERSFLWRRVNQSNRQTAHAGAKWAIAIALAEGAKRIALENIDSMESRGLGRDVNARNANQVRGDIQKRIYEKAELAGLEVASVAPRGTSSLCSRCQKKSVFWQAPDRKLGRVNPKTGNRVAHQNWLVCPDCRSSDRDHASGESIGARGFDAPNTKRNSRRKPVAGPASHRPIKHKPELAQSTIKAQPTAKAQAARTLAQQIPFPIYPQAYQAPRSCRTVSSRRVDRGSALTVETQLPERRTLTSLGPNEILPSRVLDGLANGYWRRIQFSRPRAIVQPSSTMSTQGM
jgi:hypothetical protein